VAGLGGDVAGDEEDERGGAQAFREPEDLVDLGLGALGTKVLDALALEGPEFSNSRFGIVYHPSVSPRAQKTGLRIGVLASVPQNEASGFSQNGKQR